MACSYAPKNTKPPILIHITLGWTPENRSRICDEITDVEGDDDRVASASFNNFVNVSITPLYGTPATS